MTRRRLAILGFGLVAEHGHLPAWRERDDFALVAIADPDPRRRALAGRLLPQARLYDSPDALLARESLDAVDIATPPALHIPLALRAAEAGCHILCEKPLATTVADFRTLAAAVQRAGIALCTVHNWKYSDQFERLLALLADGAVGELRHLRLETIRAGHAASTGGEWRSDAAIAGGGILVDHGWHALYLLLGLAQQPPQRIRATIERRADRGAGVEDTATCSIEFPSVDGEIFLTWAGDRRQTRWQVEGSEGTLTLADDGGELVRGGRRTPLTFAQSLSIGSHHPEWFGAVIREFVAEIDDPARRGRNLAEAERCLTLTALAYDSGARGGCALDVPTQLDAAVAIGA
jgi:predicted dehydrogenase